MEAGTNGPLQLYVTPLATLLMFSVKLLPLQSALMGVMTGVAGAVGFDSDSLSSFDLQPFKVTLIGL